MDQLVDRMKKSGGIFPTLFNMGEMWRINSARCGGKFNLFFFWMYPIAAAFMLPFTLLCFLEVLLTPKQ
jgi:hypothetical protein